MFGFVTTSSVVYISRPCMVGFDFFCVFSDGELNVLDDILTDAPDQDDELYNPDSEQDKSEKKGMWLW